jgi:aerobic carbon-monoxide dehydrogenase medium subunit
VKPAPFDYHAPSTVDEAVALLAELGDGAKVLAGGQSLVPMLALRLAIFDHLVDLRRVEELRSIERRDGTLWIGAGTTQTAIEASAEVAAASPLLARATPFIGHFQIRNRGTIGGSLAHADPAAEYPAVAVALQAILTIVSSAGERKVKADDFFKGLFETDLRPGEILTGAEFPMGGKSAFLELTRRHGDYAIIGLAAHESRFVFFNAGPKPALVGKRKSLAETKAAVVQELDPPADLYNSSATKKHLAGVLVERAWTTL